MWIQKPGKAGFCLFLNVREKPHKAGALYRLFYHALLLARKARALVAYHATMRVYELLEQIDVLVVYVLNVVLSENVVHSVSYC
ncbi:MAG: hypothetical protein RLZZ342_741 [Candidatus Parcubacteria bacterium]